MMEPARTPLVTIATTDLCAITRGRSVAAAKLEKVAAQGVGWVPANASLTPFDIIADPNPWGSRGDLRLHPDLAARYRVASSRAPTPFDLVMADIVELDGAPWECCPRSILKQALADFEAETGLTIVSAFEQEFQIVGASWRPAPAFSLQAQRRCDPFAAELMAALDEAGVEPEVFLSEYGRDQFEISCGPAFGEAAADRAVAVREITREIARLNGLAATFAPKISEEGVGNGVHLHLSFRDKSGAPVLFDPSGPGRLSSLGGAFCAGVLAHLPAITALTAPSVASYLRLRPHHWSAAWTWLGERDREATLRICPISLRVSDAGPAQKRRRGLKGRRLKASEGGNRGPLRWRRRGGWGYGDLRAGRSVERGSRPAWSAWSGMFEAICEGGSREEAHATDRRKTVLAAADDGGVSGNMPPRPLGES